MVYYDNMFSDLSRLELENLIRSGRLSHPDEYLPVAKFNTSYTPDEVMDQLMYGYDKFPDAQRLIRGVVDEDGKAQPRSSRILSDFDLGQNLDPQLTDNERLNYIVQSNNPNKGVRHPFSNKLRPVQVAGEDPLPDRVVKNKDGSVTNAPQRYLTLGDLMGKKSVGADGGGYYLTDELLEQIDGLSDLQGNPLIKEARNRLSIVRQAEETEKWVNAANSGTWQPQSQEQLENLLGKHERLQRAKAESIEFLNGVGFNTYNAAAGDRLPVTDFWQFSKDVNYGAPDVSLVEATGAEANLDRMIQEKERLPLGQYQQQMTPSEIQSTLDWVETDNDELALVSPKSAFIQNPTDIKTTGSGSYFTHDPETGQLVEYGAPVEYRGQQVQDLFTPEGNTGGDPLQGWNRTNAYGLNYYDPEMDVLEAEYKKLASLRNDFLAQVGNQPLTPEQQAHVATYEDALARIGKEYAVRKNTDLNTEWINTPVKQGEPNAQRQTIPRKDGQPRVIPDRTYSQNEYYVPVTEGRARGLPMQSAGVMIDGQPHRYEAIIGQKLAAGIQPSLQDYANADPQALGALLAEQQGNVTRLNVSSDGSWGVTDSILRGDQDAYTFDKKDYDSGNHRRTKQEVQIPMNPEEIAAYEDYRDGIVEKVEKQNKRFRNNWRIGNDYTSVPDGMANRASAIDAEIADLSKMMRGERNPQVRDSIAGEIKLLKQKRLEVLGPAVKPDITGFKVSADIPADQFGSNTQLVATPETTGNLNLSPETLARYAQEDSGIITPLDASITDTPINKAWDIPTQEDRFVNASEVFNYARYPDGSTKLLTGQVGDTDKYSPYYRTVTDEKGNVVRVYTDEENLTGFPVTRAPSAYRDVEVVPGSPEGRLAGSSNRPIKTEIPVKVTTVDGRIVSPASNYLEYALESSPRLPGGSQSISFVDAGGLSIEGLNSTVGQIAGAIPDQRSDFRPSSANIQQRWETIPVGSDVVNPFSFYDQSAAELGGNVSSHTNYPSTGDTNIRSRLYTEGGKKKVGEVVNITPRNNPVRDKKGDLRIGFQEREYPEAVQRSPIGDRFVEVIPPTIYDENARPVDPKMPTPSKAQWESPDAPNAAALTADNSNDFKAFLEADDSLDQLGQYRVKLGRIDSQLKNDAARGVQPSENLLAVRKATEDNMNALAQGMSQRSLATGVGEGEAIVANGLRAQELVRNRQKQRANEVVAGKPRQEVQMSESAANATQQAWDEWYEQADQNPAIQKINLQLEDARSQLTPASRVRPFGSVPTELNPKMQQRIEQNLQQQIASLDAERSRLLDVEGERYVAGRVGKILNPLAPEDRPTRRSDLPAVNRTSTVSVNPTRKQEIDRLVEATNNAQLVRNTPAPKPGRSGDYVNPPAISNVQPSNAYERMYETEKQRFLSRRSDYAQAKQRAESAQQYTNDTYVDGKKISTPDVARTTQEAKAAGKMVSANPLIVQKYADTAASQGIGGSKAPVVQEAWQSDVDFSAPSRGRVSYIREQTPVTYPVAARGSMPVATFSGVDTPASTQVAKATESAADKLKRMRNAYKQGLKLL